MSLLPNSENSAGAMFIAAYSGPSMNPTLREPEMMEILPYGSLPPRVGDVIFFLPPTDPQPVVHRIIRVTPDGFSTRGDNNTREDPYLVHSGSIKGRVIAAWRGKKRRLIPGGLSGRLGSRWVRWRHGIDLGVSPLLHPLYQTLFHWGFIARLVPTPFRPRVVVFQSQGQDQFQLLWGKRLIGRYDDQRQQWQIQRPFHLLVEGRALSGRQDNARSQHLRLADGTHWEISADDAGAAPIIAQLGAVMQLSAAPGSIGPTANGPLRRLLVQVDAPTTMAYSYLPLAAGNVGTRRCSLTAGNHRDDQHLNLSRLSLFFACEAQARGGALIHGALAERDGVGVILAAAGGTGKTTASNRFPAPWRSLCDDTTLVVLDSQGNYWAHPWPTWSRFLAGGPGGTWEVQRAVPLKGIFFLSRATHDRTERLGTGHAVSMLVECVGQASMFMPLGLFKEEIRALNLERFNNLCVLAKVVPAHILHISLTGTFWKEIEQVLDQRMPP